MVPDVILVDDDENLREGLTRVLRSERVKAIAADSAVQCLDLLAKYPVKVVVCDLRMPHHGGLDLLSHLKNNYPQIVRIILSGTVSQQKALEAINNCAVFRCLEKPCSRDRLVEAIHAALDQYEEQRQTERLLDVLRMQANYIRYQEEQEDAPVTIGGSLKGDE